MAVEGGFVFLKSFEYLEGGRKGRGDLKILLGKILCRKFVGKGTGIRGVESGKGRSENLVWFFVKSVHNLWNKICVGTVHMSFRTSTYNSPCIDFDFFLPPPLFIL